MMSERSSDTQDGRFGLERVGWTLVLAGVVCVVLAAAFQLGTLWRYFGVFEMKPDFADTVAILAAGEARQAGENPYAVPSTHDPLGRPHVYGPGWFVTGWLGWTVADARWLGLAIAFGFAAVAAAVLGPTRASQMAVAALLVCSPPVMLGIANGNNDLVVFMLLAGAAAGLARSRSGWAFAGSVLLGTAAVLKLYPFAALPAVLMRPGGRGRQLAGLAVLTALCLAVVAFWWGDFRQALSLAPTPRTIFAYGLGLTRGLWTHPVHGVEVTAGWIAGAAAVAALIGPRWRALWQSVPATGFSALCFVIGAMAWCLCYFANTNYPYRFVLLLLPARLWLHLRASDASGRVGRMQLLLWLLVAWLGVPKHAWASVAETNPDAAPGAAVRLWAVSGFEHGCATLLTFALLVALAGVFLRRVSARS